MALRERVLAFYHVAGDVGEGHVVPWHGAGVARSSAKLLPQRKKIWKPREPSCAAIWRGPSMCSEAGKAHMTTSGRLVSVFIVGCGMGVGFATPSW